MIVVSDTSPLTALLTVGEARLLPELFTEVVIPSARALLLRLDLEAGMYLSPDLRDEALRTVGE